MNIRKLVVVVVVVALAAIGVWQWKARTASGPDAPTSAAGAGSGSAGAQPSIGHRRGHGAEDDPRGRAPRWTLDVDREGPLRLEGQVVGLDGKGVGSAEVWLSTVPPRSAKSADDGSFAFDKLTGRTYALRATAGDLVGGPTDYKLTAHSDPVVLHLVPGATLAVTVVDDTIHPIAGAKVTISGVDGAPVTADDHGVATIKPVHPGPVGVEASAPGYAPAVGGTTIGAAGTVGRLQLTLHKGLSVAGRVVDDAGAPIANAEVREDNSEWSRHGTAESNRVRTDAAGAFTIPALAAGHHVLIASDGEHAPGKSAAFEVTHAPLTGIEIRMTTGGVLAGTVVDTGGHPVSYTTVRVSGSGMEMWTVARQTTSNENGAFELRGLPRTKLQLRAESDDAASAVSAPDLTTVAALRDLKLVLDVTGTITGTVVDDHGAPVPEVSVNAFPDVLGGAAVDGLAVAGLASATTDGAGAFTLHGLTDSAYRLWGARSTTNTFGFSAKAITAHAGDRDVRIVMATGGRIIGKVVVGATASPPSLATVQIAEQSPVPLDGGSFELDDLEPGTYDVTIKGPEFAELGARDVVVSPGKTTDLGTLTGVRGRKLTGTVVDSTGAPAANVRVRAGDSLLTIGDDGDTLDPGGNNPGNIRTATTGDDGSFAVIGIPARATNAMADDPDRGQSLAVAVAAGSDDPPPIALTLRGYGSIAGIVTLKGQPQANIAVSETSKASTGTQLQIATTGADGRFTMAKVAAGSHTLTALRTGGMSMKSTAAVVDVVAGAQTNVTIDIPVGDLALTTVITPAAGARVDAAQVFLLSGTVNLTTGAQLNQSVLGGGGGGMKFWFGASTPPPVFDELVAGSYSLCSLPLTGDLHDPTFMQRVQQNVATLRVYCIPVTIAPAPAAQTITQTLPAMTPF